MRADDKCDNPLANVTKKPATRFTGIFQARVFFVCVTLRESFAKRGIVVVGLTLKPFHKSEINFSPLHDMFWRLVASSFPN